ncbi:RidA family protein [Ferrovibrio xuzhouensis]|uniref:RidA family protein n=1 Tax=Ferrovibrio xuzhouensis TaxID=1576914 RepID=A0ABV7VLE1_9PROT
MDDIVYVDTNQRYSKAVIHGGVVHLAGQVAKDASKPVEDQTRQVLAQIDEMLAHCGTDKSRLLTASIIFRDFRDFEIVNRLWDAWVVPGRAPTRTPIEAKLAAPEYLIEIQVSAALRA